MSIIQLCGRLTVPQLWAGIFALVGVMIAVATVAFKVGSDRWPWKWLLGG
jgi:hypothetical protein